MTVMRGIRIDAHQHFWHYDAAEYGWIDVSMSAIARDFLPADSAREMAGINVDACVAVQARQTLEETRWLLALADANPTIAGVVGWVDLQADADAVRAQLSSVAHPKLVGVRHIVQSEPDDRFLLRPRVLAAIEILAESGLAFDLLIHPRHLPAAEELGSALPAQRFVLDHLAKPNVRDGQREEWARGLYRLARCSNVYAKLSGLVTEADWTHWTPEQLRPYLDTAFDAFGWQRLMIGSDWPVCTLAADYTRTMLVVLNYLAPRPPHEQDAVLGGNAQRFWRLSIDDKSAARHDRAAAVRSGRL
jgi:L-fucono-1,5-lactonase